MLTDEFTGDGVQAISILHSQCTNKTFSYKRRYNIMFQKVVHRGGESEINCIKIFQNAKDLAILVGNSYTEYQLMHTLLDNLQLGGKYSSHIARNQAELRRAEKSIDQK